MSGHEWMLIAYVPDGSTVKDRMLYASTRDSLKKQLGKSYFVNTDLYGTDLVNYSRFVFFFLFVVAQNLTPL